MNFIKEYLWSFYLGIILGYLGVYPNSIEYYIIFVPMIILVIWSKDKQ